MIEDEFHIFDVQKYKLCPNDFYSKMNILHDKSLRISHVNIRSLSKNIGELQLLFDLRSGMLVMQTHHYQTFPKISQTIKLIILKLKILHMILFYIVVSLF